MNQNTPNPPGGDDREPQGEGAPSFAKDADQGEYRNPYYGTRRGPDEPDLDADAPVLRSSDVQRLNRKALLFLAGIIALLAVMTFWLLNRAGNDEPEAPRQERPQSVVVPELPDQGVPPVQPGTDPNVPPLPVLPEEGAQATGPASNPGAGAAQGPSLVERRIAGLEGSSGGGSGSGGGNAASGRAVRTEASSAQNLGNPDALLVRGTYLRCVLETRIITDVPGFTSCIVTEPIYSINGRSLLLPKGSKILGRYQQGADIARVAVIWDRIITPTGIDVTMQSPGVDGLGGASKITSALLISLISDAFSWAAAEHGPESTATIVGSGGVTVVEQPFESATARSMERLANQALQRSAARPGTVTINQGTVVNVYVAQDVDFSSVLSLQ
jgi:type IV secretion system protein VirB10